MAFYYVIYTSNENFENLELTQLVYKSPKTKEDSVECDEAAETDKRRTNAKGAYTVRLDAGSRLLYT